MLRIKLIAVVVTKSSCVLLSFAPTNLMSVIFFLKKSRFLLTKSELSFPKQCHSSFKRLTSMFHRNKFIIIMNFKLKWIRNILTVVITRLHINIAKWILFLLYKWYPWDLTFFPKKKKKKLFLTGAWLEHSTYFLMHSFK